ncbi:hypothetical protein WDU94_007834 [Cyamophila willieti]
MIKFYIPVLTIMLLIDIQSISSYNNETESDEYDNNDSFYPMTSASTEIVETTRFNFLVPSSSLKESNLNNEIDEVTDFPKVSQVTTSNVNNVIRAPTIDYKLIPTTSVTSTVKPTVDASKIVCPIKLLDIPILQTLIPSSYLALRGVFYNLARLNSTQYFYGKAYELLEKEANIASIAAYFAKRSTKGKEKLLIAYRNSQNTSSTPMYSYLLKKKYFDVGIVGGKWTNPAWDCVLNKWIFGWILSVQGIR